MSSFLFKLQNPLDRKICWPWCKTTKVPSKSKAMLVVAPKQLGRRHPTPVHSAEEDLIGPCTLQDLYVAIQNNRVDIVRQVLAIRERLIKNEASRASALQQAVRNNNIDIVQLLISKGTDLDRTSTDDWRLETPLCTSARMNSEENDAMVEMLLNAGASPNIPDANSRTPLYHAVHFLNDKQAKMLIENGANLHAADKLGVTPLHVACRNHGDFDCYRLITLLLNSGANPNRCTNAGKLPIDFAIENRDRETVQMLLEAGSEEGYEAKRLMRAVEQEGIARNEIYDLLKARRTHSSANTLYTLALKRVRNLMIQQENRDRTGRSILPAVERLPIPLTIKTHFADYVGPRRPFYE